MPDIAAARDYWQGQPADEEPPLMKSPNDYKATPEPARYPVPDEGRPAATRAGRPCSAGTRLGLYQQAAQDWRKVGRSSSCTTARPMPTAASTSVMRSNKILKDIITRSKTLAGFDAPYVPGWDCHGLPIEHKVETTFGKNQPADLTRERCRAYAGEQIEGQKADFIRLGVLGDWDNPYKTMDFANEAGEIRALAEMVKQGFVFKGLKPVNWCFDCGSALAEAEVEYQDKKSDAIDVAFPVEDADKLAAAFGLERAEQAGRHRHLDHHALDHPGQPGAQRPPGIHLRPGRYRRAPAAAGRRAGGILPAALRPAGAGDRHRARARALELIRFRHPFYERFSPVYLAEYVELGAGTGIVHSAPAYGEDDFPHLQSLRHEQRRHSRARCRAMASTPRTCRSSVASSSGRPTRPSSRSWLKSVRCSSASHPAQLHALLAPQDAADLPRHHAQWFVGMDSSPKQGAPLRERALAAIEQTQFVRPGARRVCTA